MSNPSRAKGTLWENEIVKWFHQHNMPHVERRALSGANDKGDIMLINTVVEAKNCQTLAIPRWLREVDAEMVNANADIGVIWVKQHRKTSAADGYIVQRPENWFKLYKEAGYC